MCYTAYSRLVDGEIRNAKFKGKTDINTSLEITLTSPEVVIMQKPAKGTRPSSKTNFCIEKISFNFGNEFKEMMAELLQSSQSLMEAIESKKFLDRTIYAEGRWALKSGGWSAQTEHTGKIPFTMLSPATQQVIHFAVKESFDQMLHSILEMYDTYSEYVNLISNNNPEYAELLVQLEKQKDLSENGLINS